MQKKMRIQKPKSLAHTACTCASCSKPDSTIVEVKSRSPSDLERDELMIYNAVKPHWASQAFEQALETILSTIALSEIKKQASKLFPRGMYDGRLPTAYLVEMVNIVVQNNIATSYIPSLVQAFALSNRKLTEQGKQDKIATESRLLTLCIDCNSDIDIMVQVTTMAILDNLTEWLIKLDKGEKLE